jgi:branched-chain amino acid transport system permease protein
MTEVLQQLVNCISLGGTYALIALGLAIVDSILHLVNFAHGEILTLSGYSMLGLAALGLPWVAFAPLGILTGVLVALLMERFAFRMVRNTSENTMLLASFGLSIIIQALIQMFISPRPKSIAQPAWLTQAINVGGLTIQARQILTMVITIIALVLLLLLLKHSNIGIAMRAAAEDFNATRLMGVSANGVIAVAFAISGLLAGVAAVLTLTVRGSVDPSMGVKFTLMAFVANAIGGIGNLLGAVAGGFLLGFVEVILRVWLPINISGFTDGFLFILVALLLIFKPKGLFGVVQAERV